MRPFPMIVLAIGCLVALPVKAQVAGDTPPRFQSLPAGWSLKTTVAAPDRQLATFSQRLGGRVTRLSNTNFLVDGKPFKINQLNCATVEDTAKVRSTLVRLHANLDVLCPQEGNTVYEFVTEDLKLVERAYQDWKFPAHKVVYEVSFSAVPFVKCDYMQWNPMFNALINSKANPAKVRELSKHFTFGDSMQIRTQGQSQEPSHFTFDPKPKTTQQSGDVTIVSFTDSDLRTQSEIQVPSVNINAIVVSQAYAIVPSQRKSDPALLQANTTWPADDPEIVALAHWIVGDKTKPEEKVQAILDWLIPGKNIKYSGQTGSRYGVKTVLKQKFGHCWDFSDAFVTLCRANKIPARQVLGWLHGQSGHVWAEVLLEGQGWKPLDPTAGMGCDSRYVPLLTTENGDISLVYSSMVKVSPKP